MSGPIVRTGASPKFWENWSKVFGDDNGKKAGKKAEKKATPAPAAEKKAPKGKKSK